MVMRVRIAGIALAILCLALLPSAACATIVQDAYPERVPLDPMPVYVWNIPLEIVTLGLVSIFVPVLFIPMQLVFSLLTWLHFGHKRVLHNNVLENETRNAMYLCIRDNPGINTSSLSRLLGMNIGTLRYHVEMLCRMGTVVPEPNCRGMRYYVDTGACSDLERKVAGYLNEQSKSRILNIVLQHPGSTRKEIASRLIMSGANVTWHMKPLLRDSIVRDEKKGRFVRYYLCADAKECVQAHGSWKPTIAGGRVSGTGI
ncbi:winged helix-turn-helix transcriptional regulator [Methanoculleus thermophilus]|uniref:Predicted transcriptional regulator, containsd two HTH domains n=2 Tax=Methanoculleus thermophilus TaxID=2200 RepID=A0A1G9AXH6_9EURY|nr:winged helix-turn-helix transcriptional regulator [Methanoculleus thermophilus]SDK31574.1 Predicted transcriptional regulator, containsd two HTH domains [Methanoculleus thermophilus]